ncbi:MAG: BadF/BadG/BcrA/BcrD ATPase family protein, partial [Ignavibacteria bacterium]
MANILKYPSKKHRDNFFIGIDSGATNTEVLVTRVGGKKYALKTYKPINFNLLGLEKASVRLSKIIKDASKKIQLSNVQYIAAGISGAKNERDRVMFRNKVMKTLKFSRISIFPDTAVAFASIFNQNDRNCGILIAGTGSILYFLNNQGKIIRIGGWGRYLGDEGSGYWIGKEALNKLTKYYDGRGRKTILSKVIEKEYGIIRDNIIEKIY